MAGFIAGEVVVVDYPYTDLSQTKRRPALVVHAIPNTPNVVLCQITSQFKTDPDAITVTANDFSSGGLTQPVSNIRPNYLVTLHENLIIRVAGRLTAERFATVQETIVALISRS